MHVVLFNSGGSNGQKCPDSDVKRKRLDRNPGPLDLRHERGSEMEPRRRSGDCSILLRKNRLIAPPIFLEIESITPSDVRRQGDPSNSLQRPSEVSSGTKSDGPHPIGAGQDLTNEISMEIDDCSWAEPLGAFGEAFPDLFFGGYRLDALDQKELNLATAFLLSEEPGLDHPRIVNEEYVSRENFIDDFEKPMVMDPAGSPIEDHKP